VKSVSVSLSACLSGHVSRRPNFANFSVHMLTAAGRLGPPPAALRCDMYFRFYG